MRKIITFLTETFFHFANLLNVAVWSINFSQTAVIASSKIEIYFYHKKWYFWVKSRYFIRKREMPELSNHFRGILILNFYFLKKVVDFRGTFFRKHQNELTILAFKGQFCTMTTSHAHYFFPKENNPRVVGLRYSTCWLCIIVL